MYNTASYVRLAYVLSFLNSLVIGLYKLEKSASYFKFNNINFISLSYDEFMLLYVSYFFIK